MSKILLIEDEVNIADVLKFNLELEGLEVTHIDNGMEALRAFEDQDYDLVILDIMLPGLDGISFLKILRQSSTTLPVIIISAKAELEHKLEGLRSGADDYLPKPFNLEELLLKVKRRLSTPAPAEFQSQLGKDLEISFGENKIDIETGLANTVNGEVQLTEQEVKILKVFNANKGKILDRNSLLKLAWGYNKIMETRTVDNFISRFRKYFEKDPKKPVFFKSIRAKGYLFNKKD